MERLKLEVELAGYDPETPDFGREVRLRQVQICQDMRGVATCSACSHQEHCDLFRQYYVDMTAKRDSGS